MKIRKRILLAFLLMLVGCGALRMDAATVISAGAGNWTTGATWKTAEAGAGALQVTRSASSPTTAAYVYGTAFTCTNGDVIEGMILHLAGLGNVGTVTVALSDDGGATPTRPVTVNASTLSTTQAEKYFAFASTLTCDGGVDYKVGVMKDAAGSSGATVYRDATAGNWFHILQTNAALGAAPAAGDNIHVAGYSVVMDSTDNTDHGTVDIGSGGSVVFGTTAATNYILNLSGVLSVWAGGTLSIGTGGTRIPADSTAILNFDSAAVAQYGLVVYGTFNAYGATRTYVMAKLTADVAVNGTALTTDVSTGWLRGDVIALPSTTPTSAQYEAGDLNGDAVGTALTVHGFAGVGGGVAYAHSGTLPFRGDVVMLTRNVKIRGASATNTAYVGAITGAVVNISYAEFYWLGKNGGGPAVDGGIYLPPGVTGTMEYSALHLFGTNSYFTSYIPTFTYNSVSMRTGNTYLNVYPVAGASYTYNFFSCNLTMTVYSLAGTFSYNTVTGGGVGWDTASWVSTGAFDHNTYYGNSTLAPAAMTDATIHGLTMWRNNASGYQLNLVGVSRTLFEDCAFYGRVFLTGTNRQWSGVTFRSSNWNSDASYPVVNGFLAGDAGVTMLNLRFENCTFGVTTAFTGADVSLNYQSASPNVVFDNCNLASALPVETGTSPAYAGANSFWASNAEQLSELHFERWAQTPGTHRTYLRNGLSQTDPVIHDGSGRSERVTPHRVTVAGFPTRSSTMRQKVASGATATFTVRVRKSAAGDAGGADYAGSQPRLMLKVSYATGITSAIAAIPLDTMTVAVGNWETLTGASPAAIDDGVMEAYVDCDGNAGWINVDNWSGASSNWLEGLPANGIGGGAGGTRSYPAAP